MRQPNLPKNLIFCGYVSLIFCLSLTGLASGNAAGNTEIKVTLFGQPCLMTGPYPDGILKAIHSISPEKMPAPQSSEQTKQEMDRLSKVSDIPAGLDVYRERLKKFLEVQLAFYDSLSAAKKSHKVDTLIAGVQPYLQGKKGKDFEVFCKKADTKENISGWGTTLVEQAYDAFSEAIEPEPQEEFHRAIKRMNVTYTCSFDNENE